MRVQVLSECILRKFGDALVLVPISGRLAKTTNSFAVNAVGARIWELITQGGAEEPDAIVVGLSAEFDAPESVLQSDVRKFLGDLQQHGVISCVE